MDFSASFDILYFIDFASCFDRDGNTLPSDRKKSKKGGTEGMAE
jgi:hypothetical protein